MLGDYLRDNVKGCVHYHAASKSGKVPDWALGHAPKVRIGNHLFYSSVP
jgi:hypothetical protein